MLDTYDSYTKEVGSLTFEQMGEIHEEMLNEIGQDEDAIELYGDLYNAIFFINSICAK